MAGTDLAVDAGYGALGPEALGLAAEEAARTGPVSGEGVPSRQRIGLRVEMWSEQINETKVGMAYRRAGAGPTLVLLHGIPGSAASWQAVAAALPDTLDVIVPDLLGFGTSGRRRGLDELHAEAQATALDELLQELHVEAAVVVGHDFGGPVALSLVARRPTVVRGLGLFATNAFTDTPIPFPLSLVTVPVLGPIVGRALFSRPALRMMLRQGVGRGTAPPAYQTHVGDRSQQRAIATIFSGSLTRLAELYAPIEKQLDDLDVPVLIGWGDSDPFFDLAQGERTARCAGTHLRVYEGAGHFLPHERPNEVAEDIIALDAAGQG